jgi:acyl-CoA synthetase (AMP-forming)/AMP-acid ligase II
MIVTEGGKNVYPEDVEAAFERLPCEELCVFSERYLWPERGLGRERLTLIVRPRKQQAPAELLGQVASANLRLADYKRIGSYLLWDAEMPRTASMKVKREELARQIRATEAAARPLPSA